MTDIRTLTVLSECENVVVGELEKAANPVTVLNDRLMSELLLLLRDAHSEIAASSSKSNAVSTYRLLNAVSSIVQQYATARNKYFAGPSANVDLANELREIERLSAELDQFFPKR